MRIFSNRKRPVHLGRFPLERLARAPLEAGGLADVKRRFSTQEGPPPNQLAQICREYCAIYERFRTGAAAPIKAPYVEALAERSAELKSMGFFLDATLAATCAVPREAWLGAPLAGQSHALVVLVEYNDHVER